jgi:hypothetical protein
MISSEDIGYVGAFVTKYFIWPTCSLGGKTFAWVETLRVSQGSFYLLLWEVSGGNRFLSYYPTKTVITEENRPNGTNASKGFLVSLKATYSQKMGSKAFA